MKNDPNKMYFFDENKSGFKHEDYTRISPERFHFSNININNESNPIYEYNSKYENGSTFYIFDYLIENDNDLKDIHLRFFSEDKVDFYIVKEKIENHLNYKIIYAKTNKNEITTIKEISIESEDEELLQTINKTSIDTGAFWIYYNDVIKNAKTSNIRDELVIVLKDLRKKLKAKISDDIYVQAIIDRTLFIKYLEDKHIINAYFYGQDIDYKKVLSTKDPKKINDLFRKVHKIFNNYLFDEPTIPEEILTCEVLQTVQDSIEGVKNEQLTLFDLKFDIIPIEAISQIYEIFSEEEKRAKGIYYTPKLLTDFIVNQTIDNRIGKVIDPACGSGAFLISAFKKMLKFKTNEPAPVYEKIDSMVDFIKENIFGIDEEEKARRLTIFALYLSILEELTEEENKELKEHIKSNPDYIIFKQNIGENILHRNTFEQNIFVNDKFDFIIGNPPWKKDFKDELAEKYYKDNKECFSGKRELSELFLHKAKIWEKDNTRYGFVVNTSNFENDYSKFQDFFYKNFTIEKFYEVTNLELFTASEPAMVCIYTKKKEIDNTIILNIPKKNEFYKLFKKVLIIEEENITIKQVSLIKNDKDEHFPLRIFLVGSDGDFKIINYLESRWFEKFEKYVLKDDNGKNFLHQGIKIYSKEILSELYNIDINNISNKDLIDYKKRFLKEYTSNNKTRDFQYSYIKPNNISRFIINNNVISQYLMEDISMLHRERNPQINLGSRILVPNHGSSFKAVHIKPEYHFKFYPSADLSVLKLKENDYFLYTALLNSKLIEYYLKVKFWNRQVTGHSRINQDPILQIPIPVIKNSDLIDKISKLSEQLTNHVFKFEEKEEELNNLVYDLYGIGILEKQRINDFFISEKEKVKKTDLENYAIEFIEYLSDHLKPEVEVKYDIYDEQILVKGICVIKIYLGNKGEEYPKSKKVGRALLLDLLKDTDFDNILTLRKRLYGENTIYIIKDNLKKSWSISKASDDATAELNKIFKYKSKKY